MFERQVRSNHNNSSLKNQNHTKLISLIMISSSSFLLLLSILFTNDPTINVMATNDKAIPASPLTSNYDDVQHEFTNKKRFNYQRMLTKMNYYDLEEQNTHEKMNNNPIVDNEYDSIENGYFETDADNNQLDVTTRRNPPPRCYLCPFGEEIGDPNKFFISSYNNFFRGTCKGIYDDQEENMGKPGQGGYLRDKCRALKSDYKTHCNCVQKGTADDVTKCKEQLKDICDPNQSDDQCCIGSCRYVNRFRRNLCTTTTEQPTFAPSLVDRPPPKRCEVKITIDVANIDPIRHTRCEKRSKSFGFKYTGGNCLSSSNIQAFPCKNFETEVPILDKVVSFIRVTDAEDSGKKYFEDFVEVGGIFTLHDNGGINLIADKINVTIYSATAHDMLNSASQTYTPSPDLIIETMTFNTACDRDLFLCDSFGSLLLVSFENETNGFQSSIIPSVETYKLTIENTGNEILTLGYFIFNVTEANDKNSRNDRSLSFDYTDQQNNNMRPGERLSFEQKIMVSSNAQTRNYDAWSYITAYPFESTRFPCYDFDHRVTTYEGCSRV